MEKTNQNKIRKLKGKWLQAKPLRELFGISRTTFYRLVQEDPSFPRGRRLSGKVVIWNVEEINNWIISRSSVL